MNSKKITALSIVVATKNEQQNIKRLLQSLKKQSYKNFEIIVVDNHSRDKTVEIARKFTKKVYSFGQERSSQRNFGLKKSKGEYVLFLDADMELEKNVLQKCQEKIQTPKVVALIIDEVSKGNSFLAKIKALEKEIYKGTEIEAPRFFKRKYLLKIGAYDESLVAAEDWDLSQRIKRFGKVLKIDAKIFHWENKTFISDIKKKYYYAQNIHWYAQKHPQAFNSQASIFPRLKIFFKNPSLILFDPIAFIGLLILKLLQYLTYVLARSNLIPKIRFLTSQIKAMSVNIFKNKKRLKSELATKGLFYVLTITIPNLVIFVMRHFVYKFARKDWTFSLNGQKYHYFYGLYNFTYFAERCVEIPIIWDFVAKASSGNILEVGNVLSHYFPTHFDVLDKYEKGANIINTDIVNFNPAKKYDLIVSISTLEHVGFDERKKDPKKVLLAIANIKNLLSKGGVAVVTLPIAYNPFLDNILKSQRNILFNQLYCLKRISKDNIWQQTNFKNVQDSNFNSPYPFANAIVIAIIKK